MRYKTGKLKGELLTSEIRKLIKAHNKLVSINIPKGATREDIMKIINKNGYMVDHEGGKLRPVAKGKVKKLKVVGQGTIRTQLPKPKTEEEKKQAKIVRDKKKAEAETKAYEKRKAQVDAIKKIQQRRKKGTMGKVDPNKIPVFDDFKKMEKYYMSELEKFKKEVMKFMNKIKSPKMTEKDLKDGRKELRKLGNKKVLDILAENEELIDEKFGDKAEEKFEELESRFEKYMDNVASKITERIKELKGK